MTTTHRVEEHAKRTTLWYSLVLDDPHPPPAYLTERFAYEPRGAQIPVSRYTSREWHELERKRLWRKVWQMACREENIPDVGSYLVYDIAGDSYLVVRTRDGIKAYVNACLHRGRALKDYDGRCSEFRCSFHGFTWRLDGSLRYTPAPAEFPEIEANRDEWRLPEAAVGLWGGFVFINPDPGAEPFEAFLGSLPGRFTAGTSSTGTSRPTWRRRSGATGRWLRRPSMRGCTWAPPILSRLRTSAMPTPRSTCTATIHGRSARPALRSRTCPARRARPTSSCACWTCARERTCPSPSPSAAPPGTRWEAGRERWREVLGDEADDISDAELVDHWNYAVFPNLHPWGGYNRIVYRFRPNGDRHDESIFEVMFLTPYGASDRLRHRSRGSTSASPGRTHRSCRPSAWSWNRTRSTWRRYSAVCRRPGASTSPRRNSRRA